MVRGSVRSVLCLDNTSSHLLYHEDRVELAEAVDLAWQLHPRLLLGIAQNKNQNAAGLTVAGQRRLFTGFAILMPIPGGYGHLNQYDIQLWGYFTIKFIRRVDAGKNSHGGGPF